MTREKGGFAEMVFRTREIVGSASNRCRTVTEKSVVRYRIRLCSEKAHPSHFFCFQSRESWVNGVHPNGTEEKMKQWKKVTTIIFLVVLLLPTIAFADGENTFVVGMEVNYAPFNWSQTTDADGAVPVENSPGEYANGYDVWMAKRLAEGLGKTLVIRKMEWDGLSPALTSGKIDAIIAGMSPTPERREVLDFTEKYYSSDLVMVVKKDGKYANAEALSDFAGAKITGQLNTFHYEVLDQIEGVSKQPPMDTFSTMITALSAGSIDAYVSERPGALAAVMAKPELAMVVFAEGKGFTYDPENTTVAVGVRKGETLKDSLNAVLSGISEEERLEAMDHMVALQSGEEVVETSFFAQVVAIWKEYAPLFLRGTGVTLLISFLGTAFGLAIGFVVQVIRTIPTGKKAGIKKGLIRLFQIIGTIYVEVFRSTPMIVQAMLIFYGSKQFFSVDMNPLFAACLIVSVNTGAYLAETIRGGIDAVDAGQFEAAHALGLSHAQQMTYVILPQAMRAILPSIGNELIVNIKDTSVLNVISVTELFFITKSVAGSTFQIFQAYFIVAIIYFVLTRLANMVIRSLSRKFSPDVPFSLKSATEV